MINPTKPQIETIGEALAVTLGSGVHVHSSNLTERVDCAFPGMSEEDYHKARVMCNDVAAAIRSVAMINMWGAK